MADKTVPGKEETPVPGTAAQDGRRKLGAYEAEHRPVAAEIQAVLFSPSAMHPEVAARVKVAQVEEASRLLARKPQRRAAAATRATADQFLSALVAELTAK